MSYQFALLDPSTVDAQASAGAVFGIDDVSAYPKIGERLPVRRSGDRSTHATAAAAALRCELPPDGATLIARRDGLDALVAMALLKLRLEGANLTWQVRGRVRYLNDADRWAHNNVWRTSQFPTHENLWPRHVYDIEEDRNLADIAALAAHKLTPLDIRVEHVAHWLRTGTMSETAWWDAADNARRQLVTVVNGHSIVHVIADKLTTFHIENNYLPLGLAFCLAPVVVVRSDRGFGCIAQITQGYLRYEYSLEESLNALQAVTGNPNRWTRNMQRSGWDVLQCSYLSSRVTVEDLTDIVSEFLI